jgi:hypothetical protein
MLTPDAMLHLAAELTEAQARADTESLAAIAWQMPYVPGFGCQRCWGQALRRDDGPLARDTISHSDLANEHASGADQNGDSHPR